MAEVMETYESATRPLWDFLFGWLPWDLYWFGDYLVIGVLIIGSAWRARMVVEDEFHQYILTLSKFGLRLKWQRLIVTSVATVLLWPVFLYLEARNFYHNRRMARMASALPPNHPYQRNPAARFLAGRAMQSTRMAPVFVTWFAAILLGLVLALAFSSELTLSLGDHSEDGQSVPIKSNGDKKLHSRND
jgi:hypothetical protein